MSTGRLEIEFGYYASDTGDATAPVEVVNDQLLRVYQGHMSLDVHKPTVVEVPAGRYLVRTKLPSGEIASEQASVPPGGSETVTLASPTRSARESLGWAYYLKQTPEGAGTENSVFANGPFGLRAERARPDVLLWTYGNGKWKELVRNPSPNWSSQAFVNSVTIDDSVMQQDPQAVMAITIESSQGWRYNLGQCWLQVRLGRHSQFVALPPAERMRVLIMHRDPNEAQNRPLDVIVDGNNPRAEALLGYMATGAFESARSVSDSVLSDAEALLYDKTKDVSAATIAGYFLLKAGRADRRGQWMNNLANWFPWVPDGAVIDGWRQLRQTKPDREQARNRFVEAANRGIPFFTSGLRLLFDGLTLCSTSPDLTSPAVAKALGRVQPYAAAADWTAANTTHFGATPDDPQPAN